MTEEEAEKKWCPFARVAIATRNPEGDSSHLVSKGACAFNRSVVAGSAEGGIAGYCIASACMAWRVLEPETERKLVPFGDAQDCDHVPAPEGAGWTCLGSTLGERARPEDNLAVFQRVTATCGYCGLAGAPQ